MTEQVKTKKQIAGEIFVRMTAAKCSRQDVLDEMMRVAGLTINGAATYFSNFNTGNWSTKNFKPYIARPNYTEMSDDQLLEFYNEHSPITISGFLTRDDAIAFIEFHIMK